MSFQIRFMYNGQELNKINKTPTSIINLDGTLREETDLIDPEINIEYHDPFPNVNYMYIPSFRRYYFVTDVQSIRTGLWRVKGHCDVLKTYSENILQTECVAARSESDYNLYLNDPAFKAYANPRLQICNFPNKFSGESYILVLRGAQTAT